MYPKRLLIVIGVAAFLGSLVVFAPLQFLVGWLPQAQAARITEVSGTLVDARLRLQTGGGPVQWRFRAQPLYLLSLGVGGQWEVEAEGFRGQGSAVWRPWGYRISLASGEMGMDRLLRLAGAEGVSVAPLPLTMTDISATAWKPGPPHAVDGQLAWGPGQVTLSGRREPVAVPALGGELRTEDGRILLTVTAAREPEAPLVLGTLGIESRELHVAVLGRAVRVLGLGTRYPDDRPAFELRQTLR